MASPVTISLGYVPVFSVSPFPEAPQLTVISRQYQNTPPTCWVSSSRPQWHRSAGGPSLLCHGGYQQRRQLLSLDNERHAVDMLHSRGFNPTKLHPHPTGFIPHGQPRFLVLGPSFQRHIGHVVDRELYGPGVFRFIPIRHDGGPFPPPAPTPSPGTIKDKPSNMGIKNITDKESWTEAKKIIGTRLHPVPYWPGKSRAFLTTNLNAAVSVWWEEVIAYYCNPPVSDLFVEEHRFNGKGFKMIAHIDQHFNPSGAVDSLGYIFNLINIKQIEQESAVTLKACFSKAFSALKMGGIGIDSALQVGFMLCALLSRYHAVVQEFCLGRHSLSEVSLQTVVKQCTNYDKDPWKGPVGQDGRAPKGIPLANTAGANPGDPYEVLVERSFNHHFGRWKQALHAEKPPCMICFGTARNPEHHTCDCPILKNLGYKLKKHLGSNSSARKAASRVGTDAGSATAGSAPAPAPAPSPELQPGSALTPGAFSAATKPES